MKPTLQQCRQHYEQLDPHVKSRKTAQCLLTAIQVLEKYEAALLEISTQFVEQKWVHETVNDALASVTKPEGE